jgi:hypothetical protein
MRNLSDDTGHGQRLDRIISNSTALNPELDSTRHPAFNRVPFMEILAANVPVRFFGVDLLILPVDESAGVLNDGNEG